MIESTKRPQDDSPLRWDWRLCSLIGIQAAIYGYVSLLSRRFDFTSDFQQRPIVLVLVLLALAFALHLGSLRLVLRMTSPTSARRCVLLGALLFRLSLLPALPIQEVDIYRYLWDGSVVANGLNPYRFSPQQVLTVARTEQIPASLDEVVQLRDRSHAIQETLQRVHFGELITVYPPVSQVVFGLAAFLVPEQASVYQRVLTMKVVLTLFDGLTVGLLLILLRNVERHPGWAMLYAWSPLVLKEFANSGHLDSIAVFLTTAAVLGLLIGVSTQTTGRRSLWLLFSAALLGLGVGAKLYPIILLPVLVAWAVRQAGRRIGVAYATVALLCSAGSLAPMLLTKAPTSELLSGASSEIPPPAGHLVAGSGLAAFLSRWEINDLVFLVIVENLRPNVAEKPTHWFVALPDSIRGTLGRTASNGLQQPMLEATFLTARIITVGLFGTILIGILRSAVGRNEPLLWLKTVFLTLAWFWALAPTQNPWYWTWAMPFLPFAGRRTWSLVSLVVLAYYLRFWLLYQFSDANVPGTHYQGEQFFHYIIAPLEQGLWMLLLLVESSFFGKLCPASQNIQR